jgi:pilus assembly protein FimV
MHLRKLILAGGFACSLLSNPALALGLGEAQLNSKLNEPLKAEIKLLDTRGLSADQVLIALAAPADFERNGVERLYFYSEFEFEVLLDNPGGAIVRVSSRGPVREPFINFLVEARWPTGRLLREYTLLMDLPVFSETSASRSVVAATTQSSVAPASTARPSERVQPATAAPVSRPVVESTPQPATRRATAASAASGDNYRVDRNDTLWQIALEVRPDSSHSVHQTMLALQRLNPDAFINGNINRLRSGQVLRVPSSDDIRSLSRGEAVNEVARQNQSWGDNALGAPLSAARRDSAPATSNTGVTGSVRLATPGSGDSSVGQGSGDNTGRGRALEGELASSLEELDKATAENQELTSRVRDLEEQIQTMERLVEVSNSQLRAMQLGGAVGGAEVDQTAGAAATDSTALNDGENITSADAADVVVPAIADTPASSAMASSAASSSQRAVVTTPPPQKSLLDSLFDYIYWIGAGLLALILLLLLLWKRRQEQQAQEPDVVEDSSIFVLPADTASAINDEQAAEEAQAADADALEVPDSGFEAETNDVVSEADIYIAYGKFDQAEEMLLKGLERDPESTEIRLKLLEVYSQQENSEKFDLHYARLIALASPMVLARATELREQIPGVGDFDLSEVPEEAEDGAATAESDTDSLFDELFIDDLNDPQEKSLLADNQPLTNDDDLSFDFDAELDALTEESLTDDKDLQNAASRYDLSFDTPVVPSADSAPEENELTFDFDLGDDAADSSKPEVAATTPSPDSLSELDDFSFDFDDLQEDEATPALSDSLLTEKDDDNLFSGSDLALPDDADLELDADKPVASALPAGDTLDDFSPDAEFDANAFDLEALDREINELEKEAGGSLSLADNETDPSLFDDADEEIMLDAPAPLSEIADEDDDELSLADEDLEELFKEMTPAAEVPEEEEALFALDDDLTEKTSLDDFNFDELEALNSSEPAAASEDGFSFDELDSAIESDSASRSEAAFELDELSPVLAETAAPAASVDLSDDDLDAELDFLADADEVATKLDLARAYIDMGDPEGARDILAEVAQEGNEQQQAEASQLLDSMD